MEELTTQPLETFENCNQNSASIHPGKFDLVDPGDSNILSYNDNTEEEERNLSDLLRSEKQVSETNSTTYMSTSTSQDTGFGSASVSEISSPVENNALIDKQQSENIANEAEGEQHDNAKFENKVTSNNMTRDENVVNTAAQKEVEDKNRETFSNNTADNQNVENGQTDDENVESAALTETDENIDSAAFTETDENVESASLTETDENVESAALTDENVESAGIIESEKESVETTTLKETKAENIEGTALTETKEENVEVAELAETREEHVECTAVQGTEEENIEETTLQETDRENVEKTAPQETKEENEKTAPQETKVEIVEKTAPQETKEEKIAPQEIKEENVEKIASQETKEENVKETSLQATKEEIVEKTAFQETEEKNGKNAVFQGAEKENDESAAGKETVFENLTHRETIYEDIGKGANNNMEDKNIEKTITNNTEVESAVKDVIEQQNTKAEQKNVDVEDRSYTPAGDEYVEKVEVENGANAVPETAKDENVNNADADSYEKTQNKPAEDDHVENAINNQTQGEHAEILVEKQVSTDNVENELSNKVDDERANENVSNSAGHNVADENAKKDVSSKTDDGNVQNAAGDSANEEKADVEEKENVMDILGNGLLKKKVLVPGRGVQTRPINGDIVTVKVDGQLPNGVHVDTEELTFNLNDGDVILAFDLAVALMEEGEICELFTSERYAYGSLGREPDIPKDTSITYTLELVNIQKPPEVSEITYDHRLKMGEAKRERGNYLFGRTDYTGAINSYNRAVKLLDNPELNEGIDDICRAVLTESWVKCYNNLAACQLKIDALDAAIKSCEKVLTVQEDNVKALFRLGKAFGAKGEVDRALTYLRRAIRLDPDSKLMQQEMQNLTRRKHKETATEKELYQRMLGVKPGEKSSTLEEENKTNNSNKLVKWTLVAGGIAAVLISVGLNWYRAS